MKSFVTLAAAALVFDSVTAIDVEPRQGGGGGGGAGPYGPGKYKTDASLKDHTIFYPSKAPTEKMPVLVWGEGACSNAGLSNQALLQQIASYGFLAIAEGGPQGSGTSNSASMATAINWIAKSAGSGDYANVDASKIMAAGFSCGGTEAMDNIWNSNVKTIGVISSGLLSNYTAAAQWRKPVLFVLGGSGDIAYQNGERDFKALAAGVPSWKGNIPVGHGGTLTDANGGRFGKAILNWLLWYFKGDAAGKTYLTGGYKSDSFTVETHAFDQLTPLGGSTAGGSTAGGSTTGGGAGGGQGGGAGGGGGQYGAGGQAGGQAGGAAGGGAGGGGGQYGAGGQAGAQGGGGAGGGAGGGGGQYGAGGQAGGQGGARTGGQTGAQAGGQGGTQTPTNGGGGGGGAGGGGGVVQAAAKPSPGAQSCT